jgi:hypothetical protein
MTIREHVDKARLDARNLGDDLKKDVDAVVSEISTGIKKIRADLETDADRRRDSDQRRKSDR